MIGDNKKTLKTNLNDAKVDTENRKRDFGLKHKHILKGSMNDLNHDILFQIITGHSE